MAIRILAITHKTPTWVDAGFKEYIKRLPDSWTVELVQIPAEKRSAHADLSRLLAREGKKMLATIKPQHLVVALHIAGKQWSTEDFAKALNRWRETNSTIDLLIGGPEGLADECIARADEKWSLSKLTFPHSLVKIIIAEQIYRAYTILQKHPYHK